MRSDFGSFKYDKKLMRNMMLQDRQSYGLNKNNRCHQNLQYRIQWAETNMSFSKLIEEYLILQKISYSPYRKIEDVQKMSKRFAEDIIWC